MDTRIEAIYASSTGSLSLGARQDIFLVHGFHGSRYRYYKAILENWVTEEARKLKIPVTVYAVRFDAPSIPSLGKAVMEREVWRLRMFLLRLLRDTPEREMADDNLEDFELEGSSTTQHDESLTDSPSSSSNKIMFIGHGQGCWIIKDVLAHQRMDIIPYTYGRTEIKFLDLGVSKGTKDAYQTYLKRNWTTFSFGQPSHQQGKTFDQLVSYLQEIDENFATFANTYSPANYSGISSSDSRPSQKTYQDSNHPIWVSSDPLNGPREVSVISTLTWLLPGKQAPVAPMIGDLPNGLGATHHFAPRLQETVLPQTSSAPESPTSPTAEHRSAESLAAAFEFLEESSLNDEARPTPHDVSTDRSEAGYFQNQTVTRFQTANVPHHLRDHDAVSVVSAPDKDFATMSSSHIRLACKLGNSFLQKGELQNAAVLFEKVLAQTQSNDRSLDGVGLLMQLATVKIYSGYYEAGMNDLKDIEERLKDTEPMSKDVMYYCQRWVASCLLCQGKWKEAASKMQGLLDDDPSRYHVRLYRDQALAHANLGHYEKARACLKLAGERARNVDKNKGSEGIADAERKAIEAKQNRKQGAKEISLQVAKASIDILAGDYLAALKASTKALDYMKATVGAKHFKTLATATLKSWCLAYKGQHTEAETLCSTTYKATKAALGRNHPQTLDTLSCLISIYRSQGRFAEAIGTGMSAKLISTHGTEDMKNHPQHIHVEFQLAQSLLANGDYADSEATFSKVIPQAEKIMGEEHPETLRYKAERARVFLSLGNISQARDLAFSVAVRQFQLYNQDQTSNAAKITDLCEELNATPQPRRVSQLTNLLSMALPNPASPTSLHPFLISTLQLVAKIEICKSQLTDNQDKESGQDRKADLWTARYILTSLHAFQSKSGKENSLPAASTALDLAILLKEENSDPQDLPKAIEYHKQAYQIRKDLLGENHLDTLLAQRDLTIAQTLHSTPTDDSHLARVKKVSDCIFTKLESRLGMLHPETLTTRLWCFTLDLVLSQDGDGPAWMKLNGNLSDPQVIEQRFVEGLAMRRQLAGLLGGMGRTEQALGVVEAAIGEIKKWEGSRGETGVEEGGADGLWETLGGLEKSFAKLRSDCREALGRVEDNTLGAARRG